MSGINERQFSFELSSCLLSLKHYLFFLRGISQADLSALKPTSVYFKLHLVSLPIDRRDDCMKDHVLSSSIYFLGSRTDFKCDVTFKKSFI